MAFSVASLRDLPYHATSRVEYRLQPTLLLSAGRGTSWGSPLKGARYQAEKRKKIRWSVVQAPQDAPQEALGEVPENTNPNEPPEPSAEEQGGGLTPRLRLMLTTSLAFVICNMDKVVSKSTSSRP